MTLIEKRDAILESMRRQFACKVSCVILNGVAVTAVDARFEALLRDLANNAAQAIAEDE